MSFIEEIIYFLTNQAYYKITVLKGKIKIKTIIQKEPSEIEGTKDFIIDKKLKMAWFKLKDACIYDGKKILIQVNINNALPLVFENSELVIAENLFIKNCKKTTIKIDDKIIANIDKESGLPIKMTELTYPPTVLYQAIDANFVTKILARPPNKWEWLSLPIIVTVIVFAFVLYVFVINKGVPLT